MNKQITYNCEFYDAEVRSDTLREQVIIEPQLLQINNREVYYYYNSLEENDEGELQSSNYFLDAAFYIENDTLSAHSLFWDEHLSAVESGEFPIKLSGEVKVGDTLFYSDGAFDYALTGFQKVRVEVPYGKLKNCLMIEQITYYDQSEYGDEASEYIWIHPKYGVVKWIRTTGRIEEMISVNKR